jgi:uncharacterized membrane protein (DUF373 family)
MVTILRMGSLAEKILCREHALAMSGPGQPAPDTWACFADSVYPALVRTLTGLLIVTLCLWMLAGVVHTLWGLRELFTGGWTALAEHMIVNALIMLALLEVIRTLQAYLKLGRVRVTFILDTALVVLIGELMGLWFREYAPEKVLLGVGVIIALVALRIVTAKFSPEPSH